MGAKGLPTIPCPRCGAFERIGTEKCFACGSPMHPTEESRGLDPTKRTGRTGVTASDDGPPGGSRDPGPRDWTPMSDGPPDRDAPPTEGPFSAQAGYGYGQGYGGYGTGYGLPPGYGPPQVGYGYLTPQHEKGATTALVLGLVAFVCCPVLLGPAAIIEGRKARQRIAESNGLLTGDGMALAGMILGGIAFALFVVGMILNFTLLATTPNSRYR